MYRTISGDTWDGIAFKVFGDEGYTDRIMKINPDLLETAIFPAGVLLEIPEADADAGVSDLLPPWKK